MCMCACDVYRCRCAHLCAHVHICAHMSSLGLSAKFPKGKGSITNRDTPGVSEESEWILGQILEVLGQTFFGLHFLSASGWGLHL